mgnify:CR=1 FL=1
MPADKPMAVIAILRQNISAIYVTVRLVEQKSVLIAVRGIIITMISDKNIVPTITIKILYRCSSRMFIICNDRLELAIY